MPDQAGMSSAAHGAPRRMRVANDPEELMNFTSSDSTSPEASETIVPQLWGIVLAASDGPSDGTRRNTWRPHGGRLRPPQYRRVGSQHTLLRQTIDRASHLIPSDRLVVV